MRPTPASRRTIRPTTSRVMPGTMIRNRPCGIGNLELNGLIDERDGADDEQDDAERKPPAIVNGSEIRLHGCSSPRDAAVPGGRDSVRADGRRQRRREWSVPRQAERRKCRWARRTQCERRRLAWQASRAGAAREPWPPGVGASAPRVRRLPRGPRRTGSCTGRRRSRRVASSSSWRALLDDLALRP